MSHENQVITAIADLSEYSRCCQTLYDDRSPYTSYWPRFVGYSFTLLHDGDIPYNLVCAVFAYRGLLASYDTMLS